jgi:hypothetical protein
MAIYTAAECAELSWTLDAQYLSPVRLISSSKASALTAPFGLLQPAQV